MKKFIIATFLIVLLLLSSCISPTEATIQTSTMTETVSSTIVTTITILKVIDPISGNEYTINKGDVGVANADANVNGYFNGLNASWIGLVLNGDDIGHQFNITVVPYSNDSVAPAPDGIADWVTITNNNLVNGVLAVQPMSAASLYMTLNVPSGIQLPQDWGFIVSVSRVNQGNFATADAIRWLVHMRQP